MAEPGLEPQQSDSGFTTLTTTYASSYAEGHALPLLVVIESFPGSRQWPWKIRHFPPTSPPIMQHNKTNSTLYTYT